MMMSSSAISSIVSPQILSPHSSKTLIFISSDVSRSKPQQFLRAGRGISSQFWPICCSAGSQLKTMRLGGGAPVQCLINQDYDTRDRCNTGRIQGCLINCGHTNAKSTYHGRSYELRHVKATSGHPLESSPEEYSSTSTWKAILASLNVLYRFSRPHTVIGTAMGIISVSLLAVENLSDISPLFFAGMLEAVVSALFMNVYIVGLNQLFDIEIDKVSKPDLPLASGEYSLRAGIAIITASAIMSFGIGWFVGSWPLFWALFISFILGTAYSINIPFLRWKRFAVVAAVCILAACSYCSASLFLAYADLCFQKISKLLKAIVICNSLYELLLSCYCII